MFATHGYIVISGDTGDRIPVRYLDQAIILAGIVGGRIVYNGGGKG